MTEPKPKPESAPSTFRELGLTPSISSADLLQGRPEILIQHGEETYRLRLTRAGKLILQK